MPVNAVQQLGRLGKDIETKVYREGGQPTAYFSIVQNIWNGKEKVAQWFQWVASGKTAENMAKYCKKGDLVFLQGNETTQIREDRDGNQIEQTRRFVLSFDLVSNRESSGNDSEQTDDVVKQNKKVEKAINGGRDTQNDEFYETSKNITIDPEELPF